jgi:predicted helicase
MTAAPRVLSHQLKSASEGCGIEVASMDDHSVFGDVLHTLNFSSAIEKDLLSDYRVVIVGVDDPMTR